MDSLVDTNACLGTWPFRRLAAESAGTAAARLRRSGVAQAWVSSIEGLFHRDVAGVNSRLADVCRATDKEFFVPMGTVNPALPDWQEDLRRCHEVHRFRGIRLHPGFHGYRLTEPAFAELLQECASRQLIVQLAVLLEDERTQHPVLRVPAVDVRPLSGLLTAVKELRVVVINGFRQITLDQAAELASAGRVAFDIATLEGVDRLSALVDKIGPRRVLFGTNFPLFYPESAALKLRETALPAGIIDRIGSENARGLLEE